MIDKTCHKSSFTCNHADLQHWQAATENFKLFWQFHEPQQPIQSGIIGALQALFLGEKPAVSFIDDDIPAAWHEPLEQLKFSWTNDGRFLYDPQNVQQVIDEHNDVFANSKDPHAVMQELNDMTIEEEKKSLKPGLMLGFPKPAVEAHLTYTDIQKKLLHTKNDVFTAMANRGVSFWLDPNLQLDETLESATRFNLLAEIKQMQSLCSTMGHSNIYGVRWLDFGGTSPESLQKQHRLKIAFECFGMNDIPLSYLLAWGMEDYECSLQ